MNQLTKQELQSALSQLRDTINGNVASKQDIKTAVFTLNQQVSAQNQLDMQRTMNSCNDRLFVRTDQSIKQQSSLIHALSEKVEVINKRFTGIELQLEKLGLVIENLRAEIDYLSLQRQSSRQDTPVNSGQALDRFSKSYSY